MMGRAVAENLPRGVVLADSAYGSSSDFRAQVPRFFSWAPGSFLSSVRVLTQSR